jgi:hypothetical protein
MLDMTDTHTISLDEPVAEGVVKVLNERALWDANLEEETSDFVFLEGGEDSVPLRPAYVADKPRNLFEWLAIATAKMSRGLVAGFAATQLNLARLSAGPQGTVAFDPNLIFEVCLQERSAVVSVSPGLIMPRSEVSVSSLLAPSGGYLAWMEMLQKGHDGEDQ